MSTNELIPLFPSATHPAIPIASRILSTLRTLTAPGKGNDIKPEERAALVGVSAVLGCERIQSHDLPELSAQKASSVSPAHFRSALSRARRLLAQVDSPSTSASAGPSSKRASPRTAPTPTPTPPAGGPSIDPLSPFSTPKKKYTFSSGIDVSDLLRSGSRSRRGQHVHAHTPGTGSPLKHSLSASAAGKGKEREREGEGEEVMRTPTKRAKHTTPRGIDLSAVTAIAAEGSGTGTGTGRKRPRDDTTAFMALKPIGGVAARPTPLDQGDGELPAEEKEYLLSVREKRRKRPNGVERVEVRRRDWTYREALWGGGLEEGRRELDRVLTLMSDHMEKSASPQAASDREVTA